MNEFAIRQLAAAVMLQAVEDYFGKKATPKKRQAILKDLRSRWMQDLSNGNSLIIAEQLELHPNEIAERVHRGKYADAIS